jgi:hypothetical protein
MDDTPQSKGGSARAEKLSKEQRSEIARASATARWDREKHLPKVTHGSSDRPLHIGDIEIDCYVLDNGVRAISQRGMFKGIGFSRGGPRNDVESEGGAELPRFATQDWIKPFLSNDLQVALRTPILFRSGAGKAFGYPATILADLCDAVLAARSARATTPRQDGIVQRCEMLVRGFARVGIIALVDEATGYQEERDRDELHRILEIYLSEERLAWAKRFPDEFYKQLYRLKNWGWPNGGKRTPLVGKITNKVVYELLPEGVLDELKHRNPTDPDTGRRTWKHHQFLSEDFGQPDLRDHLLQLIAVMRVSKSWAAFERNLEEAFPRPGKQICLEFGDNEKSS